MTRSYCPNLTDYTFLLTFVRSYGLKGNRVGEHEGSASESVSQKILPKHVNFESFESVKEEYTAPSQSGSGFGRNHSGR
jgi:hypothetical protein